MIDSQSAFTCSELTIETLEQGVKYAYENVRADTDQMPGTINT